MSNEHVHPIFRELFDNMARVFSPPATPGHANDCKHNVLRCVPCTCGYLKPGTVFIAEQGDESSDE